MNLYSKISFAILSVLVLASFTQSAAAQRRDYLTDDEIELVRDAQQLDQRIEILTKAIDRRFAVLNIDVGAHPVGKKDTDKWGPAPTGSRVELFADIKQLLQKAIDDIDNLSDRPSSMVVDPDDKSKKPKGFKDIFPAAVKKLAAAADRYKTPVSTEFSRTNDRVETGILMDIGEMLNEITASVDKLSSVEK